MKKQRLGDDFLKYCANCFILFTLCSNTQRFGSEAELGWGWADLAYTWWARKVENIFCTKILKYLNVFKTIFFDQNQRENLILKNLFNFLLR